MSLKIYGLKKCTTCQKALAHFDDSGVAYRFTDVKEVGVTDEQVRGWMAALGGWEKLVNRAGYTWRGLPEEARSGLDDAKAARLVVAHPSLIRRPLIEAGSSVTVGFSEKVRSGLG